MVALDAPSHINAFLGDFVHAVQQQLTKNLVGIYLHGSLAMGSFNPTSSDIDLLIVVRETLELAAKKALAERLLQLSARAPRPLELSVIVINNLQYFRHPSPYELHFSDSNKTDFVNATVDFAVARSDPDLAAHFVITKARGVCLCGEPIGHLFPDVPDPVYLDSIVGDFDWSYANVMQGPDTGDCLVPVYAVLNFCRVLAFIQDHLVTSKREGGQWALHHLPQHHAPVIQAALSDYCGAERGGKIDARRLKEFACHAFAVI